MLLDEPVAFGSSSRCGGRATRGERWREREREREGEGEGERERERERESHLRLLLAVRRGGGKAQFGQGMNCQCKM